MSAGHDLALEFGRDLVAIERKLRAHVDDLVAENHELACRVEELERELDEALNALHNRERA